MYGVRLHAYLKVVYRSYARQLSDDPRLISAAKKDLCCRYVNPLKHPLIWWVIFTSVFFVSFTSYTGALHYKLEGRGIDSRWCHWNFSFT
jgi:hypothetical protein